VRILGLHDAASTHLCIVAGRQHHRSMFLICSLIIPYLLAAAVKDNTGAGRPQSRLVLVIQRPRRWLAKIRLDDQILPSLTVQIRHDRTMTTTSTLPMRIILSPDAPSVSPVRLTLACPTPFPNLTTRHRVDTLWQRVYADLDSFRIHLHAFTIVRFK